MSGEPDPPHGDPSALAPFAASGAHVPALDGLRAVSIMAVLGQYFVSASVPGGYGVLVFFVISGFLITRLMLGEKARTGTVSLGRFYARRVIRLYPIVVIYTCVVCAIVLLSGHAVPWIEPLSTLFYFSNYLIANADIHHARLAIPAFTHFWSLSVEEQFYIAMPCVLLLVRTPPRLAALALGACLLAVTLRLVYGLEYPQYVESDFFYMRTEFRIDALGYGVLLAALCEWRPNWVTLLSLPVLCAVFAGLTVLAILAGGLPKLVLRDLFMGLFAISLVGGVVFNPSYRLPSAILNAPFMTWVGRLSYSIYVWHYGVVILLEPYLHGIVFKIVGLAATVAIAAASYYGVEKLFLPLRHRLR